MLELAIIKEGYLSVEGLLAYLDVRQTAQSQGGSSLTRELWGPVLAAGHPWHPSDSVTLSSRLYPGTMTDRHIGFILLRPFIFNALSSSVERLAGQPMVSITKPVCQSNKIVISSSAPRISVPAYQVAPCCVPRWRAERQAPLLQQPQRWTAQAVTYSFYAPPDQSMSQFKKDSTSLMRFCPGH